MIKRSLGLILGLLSLIFYGMYLLVVNQMFTIGKMYDAHILLMLISFLLALIGLIYTLKNYTKVGTVIAGIIICDISIIANIVFPISTLVNMWVDIVIRDFG